MRTGKRDLIKERPVTYKGYLIDLDGTLNGETNIETIKKDALLSTFIMCDKDNEFIAVEEIYRDDKHIIYYSKFLDQFCGVAI